MQFVYLIKFKMSFTKHFKRIVVSRFAIKCFNAFVVFKLLTIPRTCILLGFISRLIDTFTIFEVNLLLAFV